MKKSALYAGIGCTVFGMILITLALFTEYKFEGLLWGFGGAVIGSGLARVGKFIYWSKPKNQAEYDKKLKNERIEMADERKIMLRDKSGCITYRIMTGIYCALIIIFSVISVIGYWMPFSRYLVILFFLLLVFQYVCGIVVFNQLNKRL